MTEGVEFVGSLIYPDLLKRLATEVDVLVRPALEESFSMAIAEAMGLGIPAIGGAHSGAVPFTFDKGKAGLLVDLRSPQAVAQAMLHLATDSEARLALGESARQSARRRFHLKDVVDDYEETYGEVLTNFKKSKG